MARKKGGLLFGIMMGAMLGVLFAPGKGKQLREKLLKEIRGGGYGEKTIGNNFKMMGRNIVDVGREAYGDARVQEKISAGGKSLKGTTLAFLDKLLKAVKSLDKRKKPDNE
jgi:gas vesicle protein